MKKALIFGWLGVILVVISCLFWYNDYVYSLPTPVPANYVKVKTGQPIKLGPGIEQSNGKPVLLHFFNPDCPCSKFNIKHFKALAKQYGNQVDFVVVLMNNKYYTPTQVKQKFDLTLPVVVDPALAINCGVYSTPQAAIISSDGTLYYRGNYNTSRYCTNAKTEYARIALDEMLNNKTISIKNPLALTAYGCSLPQCRK